MLRLGASTVVLALLATTLSGSTWGASAPALYIVGYDPADADAAKLAIQAAGGHIQRSSAELGFSVADTTDPAMFERFVRASPSIHYVETDSAMGLSAAQWNGAQWNAAQWNGAQWNGAQWNTAGASPDQQTATKWATQWYNSAGGTHYRYDLATSDPGLAWQWDAWAIRSPATWSAPTPGAATLCVLDSGVAWDHPDIAPNAWTGPLGEHGWNAIDPAASAYDDAGHGTHIAGVAAGRVGNAYGVAGVTNLRIMAVKVLDATGHGIESDLAFGIVWCAAQGADVAVMALSVTEPGPTLDRALQYAADRDVLMLASAGNPGPCADCVAYPASDPRVVAVSAMDGNKALAPFSAAGPQDELTAPGVSNLGPFPGGSFAFGSGTSQAVAVAAGVAGLVRDARPDLTAPQARAILDGTATDLGPAGRDPAFGHGLVDAAAALAAAGHA